MSQPQGRTFEDFTVGEIIRHPIGRTVTATDNAWTTLIAVNTNPIHFDAHYSAQTEFGKPLVNSPLTLAIVTGLSVADISRYAVNLGWDEVRMPAPVFEGDTVRIFMVRWCQPLLSAALIAWVEAHVAGEARQNALCRVVPGPFDPVDWLRMWDVTLGNFARWRELPALRDWMAGCRLNGSPLRDVPPGDEARIAAFKESGMKARQAVERIGALLASAGAAAQVTTASGVA